MVSLKDLKLRLNVVLKYRQLSYKKFPEDVIFKLLSFMFELTPTGFETYIAEYLRKIVNFEMTNVNGGYNDKGVDIWAQNDGYLYAIQCKKYGASHVKQKDILDFVQNTKHLRIRYGNKLRFYFITTSRVNKYARNIAQQQGIIIRDYTDVLKMDKQFPIYDFIKKNKGNANILEGIDVEDVLNTFYFRKDIKPRRLADIIYFIFKYTIFNFSNYGLNYQQIEKDTKGQKTPYYSFLTKESPIAKKNTFVGEVK